MVKIGGGSIDHGDVRGVTANNHHTEAHDLGTHSVKDHANLDNINDGDHHDKAHSSTHEITGVDSLATAEHFALIRLLGH